MANISLSQYIQLIERYYRNAQGQNLAKLLSVRDGHVNNNSLMSSDIGALIEGNCVSPMDDIVIAHLLCARAMRFKDLLEAFTHQSTCVQAVAKLVGSPKVDNWILPVMNTVCLELRLIASKADKVSDQPKEKILEKAAESLLSCFRVCAGDNRSAEADTKKIGMLGIANQLIKIYFCINKMHLCKPLIRAIESSTLREQFPLPDQVTYKYYIGRKAMLDSDFGLANEYLSFAFDNCFKGSFKNNRVILTYLVPVKMLLGWMPTRDVLQKYDLVPQFWKLTEAIKVGNIQGIDKAMEENESFYISSAIYLIVEKLKVITYRNLFKRVYVCENNHQIDINKFQAALSMMGQKDVDNYETQCIMANLIYEGKIKGYISYQHNKLVVSKQNAFPKLSSMECLPKNYFA